MFTVVVMKGCGWQERNRIKMEMRLDTFLIHFVCLCFCILKVRKWGWKEMIRESGWKRWKLINIWTLVLCVCATIMNSKLLFQLSLCFFHCLKVYFFALFALIFALKLSKAFYFRLIDCWVCWILALAISISSNQCYDHNFEKRQKG